MAALGWLLNLDFAGGEVVVAVTGVIKFDQNGEQRVSFQQGGEQRITFSATGEPRVTFDQQGEA